MMKLLLFIIIALLCVGLLMAYVWSWLLYKETKKHFSISKQTHRYDQVPNLLQKVAALEQKVQQLEAKLKLPSSQSPSHRRQNVNQSQQHSANCTPQPQPPQSSQNVRGEQRASDPQVSTKVPNKQRPTLSRPVKTFYLGLNNQDCFFEVFEQKNDECKFVASYISQGVDNVAQYEIIDIERIRSSNVGDSVKQFGSVGLKDAQSFIIKKPGQLKRVQSPEGDYWEISEPVLVEFKK